MIIKRDAQQIVERYLKVFPAVAILGSRQCGKSTLMKMMSEHIDNFLYVDLQNRQDRAKLTDTTLFFESNRDLTICLDEVQVLPELFSDLRSEIDKDRRPGRFILLGSASRDLLQHTTESLAGRIGLVDMTPFTMHELYNEKSYSLQNFWFRGGYPDSFLAMDDEASQFWRENYLRTYIERDIPQLGFNIAAPKMMRLLSMLCYEHGGILNNAKLASAMDLSAPTIRHYIDVLESTYIVRVLPPYFKNIRKRLVKSPRVYLRDTGLLHQVLNIRSYNELLGHSIFGLSWEGLVIENILVEFPHAKASFYRSSDGKEEMDLVLEFGDELIAIECKASSVPKLSDGFWKAKETLCPTHSYVITPQSDTYALAKDVTVMSLDSFLESRRLKRI